MLTSLALTALLLTSHPAAASPPSRLSLLEPAAGLNTVPAPSAAPAFQVPVQFTGALLAAGAFGFAGYWGGALGSMFIVSDYAGVFAGAMIGAVVGAALFAPLGVWGVSALMGVDGNPGLSLLLALAGAVPTVLVATLGPLHNPPVYVGGLVAGAVLTTVGAVVGFNWHSPRGGLALVPTVMPTRDGLAAGLAATW